MIFVASFTTIKGICYLCLQILDTLLLAKGPSVYVLLIILPSLFIPPNGSGSFRPYLSNTVSTDGNTTQF